MTVQRLCYSFTCIGLQLALAFTSPNITAAERCESGIARAVSIQGPLDVRHAGESDWQAATREEEFCPGDALRTGANSRAAIQLYPETIIRLDQSSSIVFTPAETTDTSTWLELLKGAAHLISRDPRSLKVITPFANAAIEGTEFLVEVDAERTGVIVYEGRVRVESAAGDVAVADGEQAIAQTGMTPFKQVLLHPRDAVQWTLYYPPVLTSGSTTLQQAAQALDVGQVDAARGLLDMLLQQDPGNSDALSLQSIIALTLNDKETALALATRAVAAAPQSATAKIALSYAQQAHFDLPAALASLQDATRDAPNSALAWARLAELRLSVGDLDKGLAAAERAVALDVNLAHSHTMLGFAWLTEIRLPEARAAFEQAIALDQAAPLPRLGLGLAKIRKGDLTGGREVIEVAVALDPGNSLIRSYMGKAYYEEKRDRLAGTQYEMARELDPNDPTPWFYDAIRKQTENRPVEALHDLQTSIKLNDNRAVYRSRLELDSDLATRSASIARIYTDLGFEQRALVEGWQSINTDPTNFSAHRLLADSYSARPRHEIARVSELLQSQLLQPINLTPVQPQLSETNLFILEGAGPSDAAYLEFNPLFTRNRLALQASGLVGGNDTRGDDVIHNGVYDNWSWSAGQFHYASDGFRENNDQDRDIYNLFVQGALSYKTSIQAELSHSEEDYGDLPLRFEPDDFLASDKTTEDADSARIGLRHRLSTSSDILASVVYEDRDGSHDLTVPFSLPLPFGAFTSTLDEKNSGDGTTTELQHLYRGSRYSLISGLGYFDSDRDSDGTTVMSTPLLPGGTTRTDWNTTHSNAYLYSLLQVTPELTLTLGASYDDYDDDSRTTFEVTGIPLPPTVTDTSTERSKFNPKFGLSWEATPATTLRLAAFRAMKRDLISNQTLEPTQVAGFNQFYDDENATVSDNYGIAVDQVFSGNLTGGIEFHRRNLEVPLEAFAATAGFSEADWDEDIGRAYLYWTPHPMLAASAEYQYEKFDRGNKFAGELHATELTTHRLPLGVRLFLPAGVSAGVLATYVDQEGDFAIGSPSPYPATVDGSDNFWVVDASISYRLPRRRGIVTIGAGNLLDEEFKFQDTDLENPSIFPERFVFGRLSLYF